MESAPLAALLASGMVGAAWALGRLALHRVTSVEGAVRPLAIFGLGLGLLSHVWLALGLIGAYRPAVAWTAWGVGVVTIVVASARYLRGRALGGSPAWRDLAALARQDRGVVLILGAFAAVMLAAALVPPFGIDVLRHHLNAPKLFVREGRLAFEPIVLYAYPMAGEMFYVWSLLLAGPLAGKLVLAAHGLIATAAVACLGARHGGRATGLHAALLFVSMTAVWHFVLEGKIDIVLLMHVALGLLCFDVWRERGTRAALVLSALFMGFAASSKLLGAYALAAIWCVLAVVAARGPGAWRVRLGHAALFVTVSALAGAPWYARTWAITGDPLWPALYPWLGGIEGSAALFREAADRLEARTVLSRDVGGFLRGLAAAVAGAPSLYERTLLGPLFLLGLPLLAVGREAARRCAWLLGFALAFYPIWFAVAHEGRYLASAFVALAVPAALGLQAGAATGRLAGRVIRGATLVWALTSLTLVLSQLAVFAPYLARREPLDDLLARTTWYHAEIRWMNATLPRDAVVASDWPGLYYLDRRSVWIDDFQGFVDLEAIPDPPALYRELRRWGVTHLFLTAGPEYFRLGYDHGAVLARDLAARCGRVVHENSAAVVVKSVSLRQAGTGPAWVVALRDRCE